MRLQRRARTSAKGVVRGGGVCGRWFVDVPLVLASHKKAVVGPPITFSAGFQVELAIRAAISAILAAAARMFQGRDSVGVSAHRTLKLRLFIKKVLRDVYDLVALGDRDADAVLDHEPRELIASD